MNLATGISILLMSLFIYFGMEAHWFDAILLGTANLSEMRAIVCLAALIAWTIRNELGSGGGFSRPG